MAGRWLTAFVVVTILSGIASARASQEASVTTVLPEPDAIGAGWRVLGATDVFGETVTQGVVGGVAQTYVGPDGARVVVRVNVVAPGLANGGAAVSAYETHVQGHAFSLEATAETPSWYELSRLPTVAGCDRTFRASGLDPYDFFPVGATACVTGANAIIYVVVSGAITGPKTDAPLRYYPASDYLAAMTAENVAGLPGDGFLSVPDLLPGASPAASPPGTPID